MKTHYQHKLYTYLYDKLVEITKPLVPHCVDCVMNVPRMKYRGVNGCCGGCKYLSSKGCTTKSLGCKIWFCGDNFRTIINYKEYDRLYHICVRFGWTTPRQTFKDTTNRPY